MEDADAFELDRRLRETVALDQRLDAEIGELLAIVAHERSYLCDGYRSMEEYARKGLEMAAGKVRTLLRLERARAACPTLGAAYRDGRLSWVQAGAVARVVMIPHVDLPNREAWVEWATKVSVRRLRARARITTHFRIPSLCHLRPLLNREFLDVAQTTPTDSLNRCDRIWRKSGREFWEVILARTLKDDIEWAVLLNQTEPERFAATGGLPEEAGCGGDVPHAIAATGCVTKAADSPASSERQIGAQPRVSEGDTILFFHAPSSIARLFRAVLCTVRRRIERQPGTSATEGEAFEAMLDHVVDVWGGQGQRTRAAHRVFERDGWRCTVPGCSSLTNLHDHHIVFRSAGGSNDLGNRTTLCVWHHLRGVHGGSVRCMGKAPSELRFELGVRPGKRPLLGFESGDRRHDEQFSRGSRRLPRFSPFRR